MLRGSLFLGALELPGESDIFHAHEAASGAELAPEFREASAAQVAGAAACAATSGYGLVQPVERARFLRAIVGALLNLGDTLLERAHVETALPMARLQSERGRTIGQIALFADWIEEGSWVEARIDRPDPARQPVPKADVRRMLVPLGPVAVFGASNFPLAFSVAGGDTISALAAGCPVVVKAHPAHPGTSELAARAILRAADETGMPDGVFSMLHGVSPVVGQALAGDPNVQAIGFTGSLRAGRALFDAAAARAVPIPVYAEMGSQNPVFVLPGALAERGVAVAQALAQSVLLGAGQFCTSPGVIAVLAGDGVDAFNAFRKALHDAVVAAPVCTMLHPAVKSAYDTSLARAKGATGVRVLAGERDSVGGPTSARAMVLETDTRTYLTAPALAEEIFGPATLLTRADSKADLLDFARHLPGHLTGTIYAAFSDAALSGELVTILRDKVGRIVWNGVPTGVEVTHAMHHGGPYPATTDARSTSVGTAAITRFARPVCYQNVPAHFLPEELRDENPRGILRLVDGAWTRSPVSAVNGPGADG